MITDPNLTCCFSGHRELPEITDINAFGYHVMSIVAEYRERGIRNFICGGAVGFDRIAATAVINIKRRYHDVTLTLAIPYTGYEARWDSDSNIKYHSILENADEILHLADHNYRGCMHVRNRYMVDHSRHIVCYLKETCGGTHYTVQYAEKHGLTVRNCYPFIAQDIPDEEQFEGEF